LIRRLIPCVLIGGMQRARETVDLEYCRRQGMPVLRRPSQGGAVFLDRGCLVYSLVLSAGEVPEANPNDLFDRFRLSVVEVLQGYGISARPRHPNDIEAGGRKMAGLTLTQWYSVYSLSGTLLVKLDGPTLDRALGAKVSASLTSVEKELGREVDQKALAHDLARGLSRNFSRRYRLGDLLPEEKETARYLVAAKYGNDDWNRIEA